MSQAGLKGQKAVVLDLDGGMCRERRERPLANLVASFGDVLDPKAGVACFSSLSDIGEYRIEKGVAERRGVKQDESFEIGVDTAFEGQIHQDGAGQRARQGPVGRGDQVALFFVDQEQNKLFGGSQHSRGPRADRTSTGAICPTSPFPSVVTRCIRLRRRGSRFRHPRLRLIARGRCRVALGSPGRPGRRGYRPGLPGESALMDKPRRSLASLAR